MKSPSRTSPAITLIVIGERLAHLIDMMTVHVADDKSNFLDIRTSLVGNENVPGLNVRLDRLEQLEKNRLWHIKSIWATLVTVVASGLTALLMKLLAH